MRNWIIKTKAPKGFYKWYYYEGMTEYGVKSYTVNKEYAFIFHNKEEAKAVAEPEEIVEEFFSYKVVTTTKNKKGSKSNE